MWTMTDMLQRSPMAIKRQKKNIKKDQTEFDLVTWIEHNILKYVHLYGLEKWKINNHFEEHISDVENAGAKVSIDPAHNLATITFDVTLINTPELASESLQHEMMHVLCSPYEAVEQLVYQLELPESTRSLLQQSFYHAAEQTQVNMEFAMIRHGYDKIWGKRIEEAKIDVELEDIQRGQSRRKARKTSK